MGAVSVSEDVALLNGEQHVSAFIKRKIFTCFL